MAIRVAGPDWANTRALQRALRGVPGNGTFVFGVAHCNKLEQLQRMKKAGVQCVPFTEKLETARKWVADGKTVLGRFLNHSRGTDITINKVKNTTRDYWTEYIESKAEWRIHIFDGLSIARGLKVYEKDDEPDDAVRIRNRGNEYHMVHNVEPPKGIRGVAKSAVAAVGEDFGAVDILVGQRGGFYVLEVNMAPAMDNYTRTQYVKAIGRRFA